MHTLSTEIPRYVLLDAQQPIGPRLLVAPSGLEYVVIYGFSDKPLYDLFRANSQLALKPYPLVKGFLRNQIADAVSTVQLIAVDAAGPTDAHVSAATMSSVLEAQETQTGQVDISFRLVLDPESQAYLIEKVSSDIELAT